MTCFLGFGINSDRIGLIQVCYGILGVFIQFVIFPPFARRLGILRSLKQAAIIFPIVYIITPFTALLPTPQAQQLGVFIVMVFKSWAVMFAFPCSTILLTNSATSLRILGTLNGIAVSLSALGRAVGPAISGLMFTIGADIGYGILPWWILALFAVAAAIPVWWLVEMEGFGGGPEDAENKDSHSETNTGEHCTQASVAELVQNSQEPDETTSLNPEAISKVASHSSSGASKPKLTRRISTPIGMKESIGPGGDRISNGLGQSNSGYGTSGSSC